MRSVFSPCSFFFLLLFSTPFLVAGEGPLPPGGLTTDLLEHTDRVWIDGYVSTMTPAEIGKNSERHQTVAIRKSRPRLGWVVNDTRNDVLQDAYRVLLSDAPEKLAHDEGNYWDSGKVESGDSVAVRYAGKALEPDKVYYWKVKTWNKGVESPFSAPKAFRTAPVFDERHCAFYPLQKSDQFPVSLRDFQNEYSGDGVTVRMDSRLIDFGKAAFGQLKLTVTAEYRRNIFVHFGEAVTAEGRIDRKPGGTIRYAMYELALMPGTHTYTIAFRPDKRNTGPAAIKMPGNIGEVYPFRYVELEGNIEDIRSVHAVRVMVHYPFNDAAARFHSSDETLNAVWELCRYSMKATSFCGIFVDGDRERIPYEADALINQYGYYSVDREFSIARRSHEYLIEHATWPTEWILQSALMADIDFLYTGNLDSAEAWYADLKAKLLLPLADADGLISTKTGKQTKELLRSIHFKGKELRDIVDWPHTGILGLGKSEGGETDGFVFTEINTVVNAYHYAALTSLCGLALYLDKEADRNAFESARASLYKTFNEKLFDTKNGRYVDGVGTDHASLHANMFALAFGLVPDEHRESVLAFIRSRGMACSVYGSQFLMDAVYQAGGADYGLALLTSREERSWYNMIRVGSTISLEAWDNKYKPNQDWNHAWGAVPANVIPRRLMGIRPSRPGFESVRVEPQPASLNEASLQLPTIRGTIKAAFTNTEKTFTLDLTIPANMKAEVVLPFSGNKQLLGSGRHRLSEKK